MYDCFLQLFSPQHSVNHCLSPWWYVRFCWCRHSSITTRRIRWRKSFQKWKRLWRFHTRMHVSVGFCCVMLCILCHFAVSVCLSVTFMYSIKMNKHIFKVYSSSGSHTIVVFPHQTLWQYSDENPPKRSIECRWARQKLCFSTNIWLHRVLSIVRPQSGIYTQLCQTVASWWHSSLVSSIVYCSRKTDD